jgi:uncharacterized membrane protein YeaQ/YmgE (transglycosylase-associated protein family)
MTGHRLDVRYVWAVVSGWIAGNLLKIANGTGFGLTSIVVGVVGALIVIFHVGNLGGRGHRFARRGSNGTFVPRCDTSMLGAERWHG